MATGSLHFDERRVLSRPFPVEWAGFRSTTFDLQRAGWQLAVERYLKGHARYDQLVLIGRHYDARQHLYAVATFDRFLPCDYLRTDVPHDVLPPFHVRHVSPEIEMRVMHMQNVAPSNYWEENFEAIDARPQLTHISQLSLAQIFAPGNTAAEEIFVQGADMSIIDHLEAIKKLQAPVQARIREERRRREWRDDRGQELAPRSKTMANVIQLIA